MSVFLLLFLGSERHLEHRQSRLYTMLPEDSFDLAAVRLSLAVHTIRIILCQK